MSNSFVMYAKYFRETNETIYGLLDALSNEERERECGSYYKSLSGLFRHVFGGTQFFSGLFSASLDNGAVGGSAAKKAIAPILEASIPEGFMVAGQWKELKGAMQKINEAFVNFNEALTQDELRKEIAVPVFGGNPPSAPLEFLLHEHIAHFIHHHGQLSQVLDEMKIEHNFSGINVKYCY